MCHTFPHTHNMVMEVSLMKDGCILFNTIRDVVLKINVFEGDG